MSSTPIDFGKFTLIPGDPRQGFIGRTAIGEALVTCSPPAHNINEVVTSANVDYSVTSTNQEPNNGSHKMTLNGANLAEGIFYSISKTGLLGGDFGPNGTVLADVVQELLINQDTTSFRILGRITGTNCPDDNCAAGIYRSTLFFITSF